MAIRKKNKNKDSNEILVSSEAEPSGTSPGDDQQPPAAEPLGEAHWLEHADGEIARLRSRWSDAQAELERSDVKCRELESANARLRDQVHDLEAYIEGRKRHWAELQTRVEQYEDALTGMQEVVRSAEEKLSKQHGDHDLLGQRVIELERRCAELAGRLQEREKAQRDDQHRLKQRSEEIERLREAAAAAERAKQESAEEAAERAKLTASLERCVARRDRTIEELEERIQAQRESINTLEQDKLALGGRIGQLDRIVAERDETVKALGDELQQARDDADALRAESTAQQQLIGELEAELESRMHVIEALRSGAGKERLDSGAAFSNGTATESRDEVGKDASEDIEIIRLDDLYAHGESDTERPVAVLEAPDGTAYPVSKANVTIGRSATSDICIKREFVSRLHARLITRGIGTIIEDAGSKNGILVNSEPVGRRLLVDGDVVSLGGKLDLRYVELDEIFRRGAPSALRAEPEPEPELS